MKKIDYLDGLRGLAALIVTIAHFFQVFYPTIFNGNVDSIHSKNNIESFIYNSPLNLILNANFCVCIFFVLSAYVLSIKFFKYKKREIIISSAVRRYFRLVIPIASSLIIAYLLICGDLFFLKDIIPISKTDVLDRYGIKYSFFTVLKQAFFQVFFIDIETYNAALWTIKYEFIGSFIIFSFLFFFGKSHKRKYIYAILLIVFMNSYYLAFILGIILSDLSTKSSFKINEKRAFVFFICGLFLGSYPYSEVKNTIYRVLDFNILPINSFRFHHIMGAFLLILSILLSQKIQGKLSNKIIRFFGNISFSMYLIHFIVINSLSCYLFKVLIKNYSYHFSFLITFIISFFVILLVSHLMYKYIDLVGIRFSHKICKSIKILFDNIQKKRKYEKNVNNLNKNVDL